MTARRVKPAYYLAVAFTYGQCKLVAVTVLPVTRHGFVRFAIDSAYFFERGSHRFPLEFQLRRVIHMLQSAPAAPFKYGAGRIDAGICRVYHPFKLAVSNAPVRFQRLEGYPFPFETKRHERGRAFGFYYSFAFGAKPADYSFVNFVLLYHF